MAGKKTYEEKMAELDKREEQVKAQKKKLRAQHSKEERKKRTHNLIEVGGAVYSVLGREFVEGDVDRLIAFLKGQDNRGNYFTKAMNDFPTAPTVDNTPKTDEPKEETV